MSRCEGVNVAELQVLTVHSFLCRIMRSIPKAFRGKVNVSVLLSLGGRLDISVRSKVSEHQKSRNEPLWRVVLVGFTCSDVCSSRRKDDGGGVQVLRVSSGSLQSASLGSTKLYLLSLQSNLLLPSIFISSQPVSIPQPSLPWILLQMTPL